MPSFLSGLANAVTAGARGYAEGSQEAEARRAAKEAERMKALVLAAAMKRQQEQDAIAAEERTYKREQDAIGNRIKGYTPGETTLAVAPAPEPPATPPSLTTPITEGSLGAVPKVAVTSTPDSFVDPQLARSEATAAAQAARDEAQAARADARQQKAIESQDRRTAAQIAAADRRAAQAAAGTNPKKTAQMMRLSSQFDGDPIIKNAKEVVQGIAKVKAAANDPTPAGDLALLYGYNKLLDPGSVVRESEFATAAKTGSLPQQIQAAALKVIKGVRLTPEQRADFLARAQQMAQSQQTLAKETMKRHAARAERMGVDPQDVVYDPFEETLSTPPAGRAIGLDVKAIRSKYGLEP